MDELVERVRQALAAEYTGAGDGRIRDVPDRRAIRWYTTIGLVDRPLGMRGRTALYGPRHLQQLVAIKRRQAAGRSLSQIQGEFSWLSDEALAELSDVPETLLEADGPAPDDIANDRHMRFWARQPTPSSGTGGAGPLAGTRADVTSTQGAPPQLATDRASSDQATSTPAASAQAASTPAASAQGTSPQVATSEPAPSETTSSRFALARSMRASLESAQPATTQPATTPPATTQLISPGEARQTAHDHTLDQFSESSIGLPRPMMHTPVHGVSLRGGVILLVPHPLSDRDRDDVAAAAAPLLDLLAARGLLDGSSA